MTETTEKRGRGRPVKYEIEQIDASPEELARAIFEIGDRRNQEKNDNAEEPETV